MQISIESVQKREDPYQLFLDSFKNKETKRKYINWLFQFLKLIPSELFAETGEKSNCQEVGTLSRSFVELARKNPNLVQNIIAEYIKEEKKLVDKKELNPNTLPNHIKPIKFLLDANGIAIHWKSLYKLFPRPQKTEDRAYTKEEIQKMLEVAPDIADKVIIHLFSAGGFRLGAWDYFTWKDVIFFKNKDDSYKGAALLVYRGDPESYWTFITPEACKTLEIYREAWKSKLGKYPLPDDPLIKSVKLVGVHRLDIKGIRRRMDKIVTKTGLRPPLTENKKRHEVALDHGFRKYFNTMMRRAKVNYLDKEDMMGHKTGLEKHYERYREEDFERFPEYQKAIPFLTISDEERIRSENSLLKEKITHEGLLKDEISRLKQSYDFVIKEIESLKRN